MRKHKLALLGLVVVITMGGILLFRGLDEDGPFVGVIASGVPDTKETQKIQGVIMQGYKLYDIAGRTFDTSQFPSVFADDPDVPLTRDQRERLQEWLGTIPKGAGYLTYVTACYTNREKGALLLEELMAKVRAEGRDSPTRDEWMEIVNESGGRPPAPRNQPSISVEEAQKELKSRMRYDLIDIKGDKATVIFDTGITLNKMILVKRDGKWYVAGEERLAVTG